MALSFGIGAVKKKTTARGRKKTTTSKTKKTTAKKTAPKAKGRKPTAGSKVSASGKRYYPSTPKAKKSYTATNTCSNAGKKLKTTGDSRSAAVLALCKASVQNLKITEKALKRNRVQIARLSKK